MVIKGLARARKTIIAKNRLISESHFNIKMYSFSVQNDKILSGQISISVEVFGL